MKKKIVSSISYAIVAASFLVSNFSICVVVTTSSKTTPKISQPVVVSTGTKSSAALVKAQPSVVVMSAQKPTSVQVVSPVAVKAIDKNAPQIASDENFIIVQKNLNNLHNGVNQIIARYKEFKGKIAQKKKSSVVVKASTTSSGQSPLKNVSSQQSNTDQDVLETFEYQKNFEIFKGYISGTQSYSYLSSLQGLMTVYQGMFTKFQTYMQGLGNKLNPDAQFYFIKSPFQNNSHIIAAIGSTFNVLIAFLSARCGLVNARYYAENNAADLFGDQGLLDYSDLVVATVKDSMDKQFQAVQAINDISNQELVLLQSNYQSLVTTYLEKKNVLIVQTVIKLLEEAVAAYPVYAVNGSSAKKPVNVVILEKYLLALEQGCAVLEQLDLQEDTQTNKRLNLVGTGYTSFSEITQYAHKMLANLYMFNYKILSKNLEDAFLSNVNESSVLQVFDIMNTMVSNIASHSMAAQEIAIAQMYYTQATLLQTIISNWQAANKAYAVSAYAGALAAFNKVVIALQNLKFNNCAGFVVARVQMINLEYEKALFQMYVSNPDYSTALVTYIKNSAASLSSGYEDEQTAWCSMWHPSASPKPITLKNSNLYQGFYVLASNALQTLQSVIGSIENNQFSASDDMEIELHIATKALDSLVDALHEMLVEGSLPNKQPADNNLYSNYYTPVGYREVFLQYQKILQKIDQVDVVFAKYTGDKINEYMPLQQFLHKQKTVKSFGVLFRLHYARWAFAMGVYASTYASSPKCLTDKVCVVYKNSSLQFALCALRDARRVYSSLGMAQMATMVQAEIEKIKESLDGLVAFAKALENQQSTGVLQHEQKYNALFYYQIAASIDPAKYGSVYAAALEALLAQEKINAFNRDFPDLYSAYLLYKAYLWASFTKNTAAKNTYKVALGTSCTALVTAISRVQNLQKTSKDLDKSIAYVGQLENFQQALLGFSVEQEFDQWLVQIFDSHFIKLEEVASESVLLTQKKALLFAGQSVLLSNAVYDLAQLYVKQADVWFAALQKIVNARQFGSIGQDSFSKIIDYYTLACQSFSDVGATNEYIGASSKLSATMALYYYSLVMPCDQLTAAAGQLDSNSNDSSAGESKAKVVVVAASDKKNTTQTSQAKVQEQSNFEKPVYLVRAWRQNITEILKSIDQNVDFAKQQADTQAIQTLVQTQQVYQQILSNAKALVGSKNGVEIINKLVVPLYQHAAARGGYQSIVRPLDEHVKVYTQQLIGMFQEGIMLGGKLYKTQFSLVNEKNSDGTESIVLNSYYLPVAPIPEFVGDPNALMLYMTYQKFFSQGEQVIQIDAGTFFPIPDPQLYKQAQLLINQAYFGASYLHDLHAQSFVQAIKSNKNISQDSFALHKAEYAQLQNMYLQIFSLYDLIDQAQQEAGLTTFNIQKLYTEKFQEYADGVKLFMIGNPLDSDYISVVNNAAMNYLIATNYITDLAQQSQLYTKAANVYKAAGDACANFVTPLPSVNRYPSPEIHQFPVNKSTVELPKTITCVAQPKFTIPLGAPVVFHGFEGAYGYYQQALQNYRKAYALLNKNSLIGELADQNVRTAWVLYSNAAVHNAMQSIVLFGRNAFAVVEGNKSVECGLSSTFKSILDLSGNTGSALAVSLSSLSGVGSNMSNNLYAQSQYAIMKKLLLQGLIYLSSAMKISGDLTQAAGVSGSALTNDSVKSAYGNAMVCAFAKLFPTLSATVNNQVMPFVAFASTTKSVDILTYLTTGQQYALLHADGFAQLTDYMYASLAGTEADGYSAFKNASNTSALSLYISQMYSLVRSLYGQIFLPELAAAATASDGVAALQGSINSAIVEAQQEMLVNASGYVG